MKIGQYAFWKFGPYPYWMGGEIIDIQIDEENGLPINELVKIKGLENHNFLRVEFSVSAEHGKSLLDDLKELADWKEEELKKIEEDFDDRVKRTIKEAKTKNFY